MNYWLIKSEPNVWSIEDQIKAGQNGATWDGVRNYQAAKNLRDMKIGDLCFFYHSNIGKEIVGIVKVVKEAFIDPTDKMKKCRCVCIQACQQTNTAEGSCSPPHAHHICISISLPLFVSTASCRKTKKSHR